MHWHSTTERQVAALLWGTANIAYWAWQTRRAGAHRRVWRQRYAGLWLGAWVALVFYVEVM